MKKFLFSLLVLVSFVMTSCSPSIDSLIDKYEAACKKGDFVKMTKISNQIQEQLNEDNSELTLQQAERMAEIALNCN